MKQFLKQPLTKFLVKALLLYLIWYLLYDLWIHPKETFDLYVIDNTILLTKKILIGLGYTVFTGVDRLIGIDGTNGVWIGDHCNAVNLFALFSGFILAFPGSWKNKLWYIPLGIITIQLLNVLRVVALTIILTISYKWTEFNHTYTFTLLMYGYIFTLWMIWVNKFSKKKNSEMKENKLNDA